MTTMTEDPFEVLEAMVHTYGRRTILRWLERIQDEPEPVVAETPEPAFVPGWDE
jgi:hypothetical protein